MRGPSGPFFIVMKLTVNINLTIEAEDGRSAADRVNKLLKSSKIYKEGTMEIVSVKTNEYTEAMMVLPKTKPKIRAVCHSDDYAVEVEFDCVEWFEYASVSDIVNLALEGWGGDYSADAIADYYEEKNPDIDRMFDYIYTYNGAHPRNTMGFECYINDDEALNWLQKNRPNVMKALDDEGLLDEYERESV